MKLSKYDEDWYVEVPANAALKALVRSCPDVLALYDTRLRSDIPDERLQAANALREISKIEPELLDRDKLREAIQHLKQVKESEAVVTVRRALAAAKSVRKRRFYRYGL
jgi:hypothetical protein